MRRKISSLFLLPLILAGCGLPGGLPAARGPADLGKGGVVLVGSVEIVPPLAPGEQTLSRLHRDKYRDCAVLLTARELPERLDVDLGSTYRNHIRAPLGEPFFVRVPEPPLYYVAGVIFMDTEIEFLKIFLNEPAFAERAVLPGGVKLDLKPEDQAVYIGHIRYHRGTFFEITRIEVIDRYPAVKAEFIRRFGEGVPLRKALLAGK